MPLFAIHSRFLLMLGKMLPPSFDFLGLAVYDMLGSLEGLPFLCSPPAL